MNKLGFYVENTTVPYLRDAIRLVKPPVILIHAQDRGLLQDIRRELSPNSFIIGRRYVDIHLQNQWLRRGDPAQHGSEFADQVIAYDFGLAKERGANGRLLIDAWMSLNEIPRGPASFPGYEVNDEFRTQAEAYDVFQEAFRERLEDQGLAAIAFNFAAGNYTEPEHYLDWFPRTLAGYTYLGFHEYGWPSLVPGSNVHTAAGHYRHCMQGIQKRYGTRHKVVVTELGLTQAYGHPGNPDVGWLNDSQALSEDEYWLSLLWYNNLINIDPYVIGACLFQVGHSGARWRSFRHIGEDNQRRPIYLMQRIAALGDSATPVEGLPPDPAVPDLSEAGSGESLSQRTGNLLSDIITSTDEVARLDERVDLVRSLGSSLAEPASAATASTELAASLDRRLEQVQAQLQLLREAYGESTVIDRLQEDAVALGKTLDPLQEKASELHATGQDVLTSWHLLPAWERSVQGYGSLENVLNDLARRAERLRADIPGSIPEVPTAIQDVRLDMPHHPDPGKRYLTRKRSDIRRIVIHHTVTSESAAPAAIAQAQISRRDLPGITYHYVINGRGDIFYTQSLDLVVLQSRLEAINADGVAVALLGDFTAQPPGDSQLNAAADLVAWLLVHLNLTIESIAGRRELERVGSPGAQWLSGAHYKEDLLARVEERL